MYYKHHVLQRICEAVQQKMENKPKDEEIEWDVLVEIVLFHAMFGLKPVGVNRYFTMMAIHQRFSSCINREISSKVIWDHLDSMYDMAALHESEILPFPNEEVDFELPEEFDDLVKEKYGISLSHPTDENETPKSNSSVKTAKKLNTSKVKPSASPVVNSNTFLTPVPVKPAKNNIAVKSDSRPPSAEISSATAVKIKPEVLFPAKVNKVKRSSSPFSAKNVKPETPPVKDETADTSSKKNSKQEGNSSSVKKIVKSENTASSSSSKKSVKQESSSSSSKQAKSETPDNSSKKSKSEKELSSKKGRSATTVESTSSKKSNKVESKKADADGSQKRVSDASTSKSKTDKNSSKGPKLDDSDSGSRKSVGKIDPNDKKRKRQKLEESTKKTPPAKRRRA